MLFKSCVLGTLTFVEVSALAIVVPSVVRLSILSDSPSRAFITSLIGSRASNCAFSASDLATACSLANSGDVILIAGKGHEKYQEINGEKLPFDDLKILKETFEILKN